MCDCFRVALASSITITLLDFGRPYEGNSAKVRGALHYVRLLPSSALVLFIDAYDVLLTAPKAAIIARFVSLELDPGRVLFMAEVSPLGFKPRSFEHVRPLICA
jgi:hypothetical protein